MSDRKQPVDNFAEKPNSPKQRRNQKYAGIGGGVAGAAIGGLLGRRIGGNFGTVVGIVGGALVGRGTAMRVNRTVDSIADAAKSVAQTVNHNVNGVGNAVKNTVQQVQPSVVGVVDAVKNTVEQVQPSVVGVANAVKETVQQVQPTVVGIAQTVAEAVNQAVGYDAANDTEPVQPSVNEPEPVQPVDNPNNLHQPPVGVQPVNSRKEHPVSNIDYKNIQQTQEEFLRHPEKTVQHSGQEKTQSQAEKIQQGAGILLGAASISLMGATFQLSPKQNLIETTNQSLISTVTPAKSEIGDGWIFLGNINNTSNSKLVEQPLTNSHTNSPVVPSVGSVVTVTVKPGVRLRKNKPQQPNFNPQEQKVLAILKDREKLKILKVEFVAAGDMTQPRKVWAEVQRCGNACN